MSESRNHSDAVPAWISTGTVVALLSCFGLMAGTGAPPNDGYPAATQEYSSKANGASDRFVFPSVDRLTSLEASMWDDPFELADDIEIQVPPVQGSKWWNWSNCIERNPKSAMLKAIENKLGTDGKLMVLIVSAPGGKFPQQVSARRRRRHAVEVALANLGFRLSFPERMTYRNAKYDFHFSPANVCDGVTKPVEVILPTKLYEHPKAKKFILLTWLQDTHLGKQPFNSMKAVVGDLVELKDKAAFCLLGPSWSESLKKIIEDGKIHKIEDGKSQINDSKGRETGDEEQPHWLKNWSEGIALCNAVCTASNADLGLDEFGRDFIDAKGVPMRLIHAIGTDRHLLELLQHELELRGVWPDANHPHKMVLFAEKSSRSYVENLRAAFEKNGVETIVIPYLKRIGIDGNDSIGSPMEDYLIRSLGDLSTLSTSRFIEPSKIRAVGILGSHWEDKNLILAKARGIFPSATFFTTELDWRFNLPESTPHCQNLIVASHYGLGIDGSKCNFPIVNRSPSFRDGYQTSTFIGMTILGEAFLKDKLKGNSETETDEFVFTSNGTTQNLFNLMGRGKPNPAENRNFAFLKPAVFEIGRHHAVQLSSFASDQEAAIPFRQPPGPRSIYKHGWLVGILIVLTVAIILFFNFLAAFSQDANKLRNWIYRGMRATSGTLVRFMGGREAKAEQWKVLRPVTAALALGLCLVLFMIVSDSSMESEPLGLLDGISLWPSICGLYLVIVIGICEIRRVFPSNDMDESRGEDKSEEPPKWGDRGDDWVAFKLTGVIVLSVCVISYLESGIIIPPARDWRVRLIAHCLLAAATFLVVFTACRCLLFSLATRMKIGDRLSEVRDSNADLPATKLVEGCVAAMDAGTEASRELLGPVALAILFIFARARFWDSWGLDRTWLVLLCVPILFCLLAAIIVRRTAIVYRYHALDRLRGDRYKLLMESRSSGTDPRNHEKSLELSISEISQLSRGPYGPLSHDYLLGAFVLVAAMIVTGPFGPVLNRLLLLLG